MSLSSENTVMTMPVAPAYNCGSGYGNGSSMWGGDWASWIILFLIFGMFGWGGMGFGGGWGRQRRHQLARRAGRPDPRRPVQRVQL